MNGPEELRQSYLTDAVIAGSMVTGVFVYVGVLRYLQLHGHTPFVMLEARILGYIGYTFFGLAGAVFLAIRFLRRAHLAKDRVSGLHAALGRLRMATVVSCALAETIAVLGLVLGLLGGSQRDVYILFGISLVLLFVYFPRPDKWKALTRGASSGA